MQERLLLPELQLLQEPSWFGRLHPCISYMMIHMLISLLVTFSDFVFMVIL